MPYRVIDGEREFIVKPEDIVLKGHLWDAFGNMEKEVSAHRLVRFAQERGEGWKPFTKEEIDAFEQKVVKDPRSHFSFNGLDYGDDTAFIVKKGDLYHFTSTFVLRCLDATTL